MEELASQTSVDPLQQAPTATSNEAKEKTGMFHQVFMYMLLGTISIDMLGLHPLPLCLFSI